MDSSAVPPIRIRHAVSAVSASAVPVYFQVDSLHVTGHEEGRRGEQVLDQEWILPRIDRGRTGQPGRLLHPKRGLRAIQAAAGADAHV